MIGSKVIDLLSRYFGRVVGSSARPNECRRRAVVIPCYLKEKSLWKLLKKFGRDPTVGLKVTDLFSRYFGPVGGTTQTVFVGVE